MPVKPLLGIVLVAHEHLGKAFVEAITHILGYCPEGIETISTNGDSNHRFLQRRIKKACEHLEQGRGVLILADLYGASTSNFCCELIDDVNIGGIAGVNLPMLLKAVCHRESMNLSELLVSLNDNHQLIQKLSRRCHHVECS